MTPEREAQMRDQFETLFPGNPSQYKASAWDGFLACARALEPKWQPIETAPKDGRMFLGYVDAITRGEDDDGRQFEVNSSEIDFCQWHAHAEVPEGGWFENMMGSIGDQQHITHWMPLPEQPKTAMSAALEDGNATKQD